MVKNNKEQKLLEVKNLNKIFVSGNSRVHAVNDVSFDLQKGETIGLIGESGSGKTTIGRTIIRLNDPTSGQIILKGTNIGQKKLSKTSKSLLRNNIQMIFQDPYSSLNEQMNIMNIIAEPIRTQKLDKKYMKDFTTHYDEMIEFYKYFLTEEIDKLKWANAIKNKEFALSEFKKEVKRLKSFEITAKSKWEEIDSLTSLYYGVKIDGNATITNNCLTVSKDILTLWKNTNKELIEGKVFNDIELKLKKAEDKVKLYCKLSKNVKEFYEYKRQYKTVKRYNKIFKEYIDSETKAHKGTVKGLISILKEQSMDGAIKSSSSSTIADYNFSKLESKVKSLVIKNLKSKANALYSIDIIEATEKFEKRVMFDLIKAVKGIKKHSKISFKDLVIDIDGRSIDLTSLWDKTIKKTEIFKKDIIMNFSLKSDELLVSLSKKERDYINSLPKLDVVKMVDEERSLKLRFNEFKKVKVNPKHIETYEQAKATLIDVKDENNRLKEAWLVKFKKKHESRSKKFEKEFELVSSKVEKVVNETKKIYIQKKEQIINSDLPWFVDKDYKKPEKVFEKKKLALQKKLSDTNKSLEVETERVLKDINMLRDTVVGNKFRKKTLKEYLVREKVFEVLEEAGLTKAHAFRYPHEFSGGMRQRVGIARAIISRPDIIVADEPIAALDLSIQAQIANLLKGMQEKREMSMIFIAHDLSMVKHISDKILIIHLGRIVESGTTKEIFNDPIHPYTKNLIKSMPDISRISKGFENNNFEAKYLNEYSVINQPEYIVKKGTHKVLATKEQFKKWTK